jgi:ADP-heptose:LPS heptosyltransferase
LSSVHQGDRFSEIIVGQVGQVSMTTLSVPKALRTQAESYLASCGIAGGRPLALVHPGSGSRDKCATPEVLLPVLEGLEAEGYELLLLEGPADHEPVARLLPHMTRRPVLVRGLSVRLLAGVLSKVDLFVGHDSGVTHLASLLGTPTVGLFGPTDPARWAPRGPSVTIIRGNPCGCASWDAVKRCAEKPCLELSPMTVVAACQNMRAASLNPRIC